MPGENGRGSANIDVAHGCRLSYTARRDASGQASPEGQMTTDKERGLEMVRHYVAMASIQQNLLERRASPMDRFGAERGGPRHARRIQPKRRPGLKLVR